MEEVIQVLDNMQCDVCGEKTFQEREGFFYCIECGTQKQQIQAVDLTADEDFNETAGGKHTSRVIRQPKKVAEANNDITSWEFYNYVLRGFLQELLDMGAKPELKLMTLQVWAAYMSQMEVAFCRSNDGLPKLNVRVLHRDARIIYDYKRAKLKKIRKGIKSADPNDERAKLRMWNKTKRKLDASGYTKSGAKKAGPGGQQSIGMRWSWKARKTLKRTMSLKHLDKHSRVSSMQCHGLRPKAKELHNFDRNIYNLNSHKLYVVLAIALNMVEDDIQLTDLLRLVEEEHLTSRYMLKYLPANVAAKGKTLIKGMELGNLRDQCSYTYLRNHVGYMAHFINLSEFQKPNLLALAERYVLELGLPPRVAKYVGSLLDLHPPRFSSAQDFHVYPRYEPRVMAYIVYVMKLLFGLDDVKERKISMSAKQINEELQNAGGDEPQVPPLFVFTEWMHFVELRKEIVAQYNQSFARRFGVANKTDCQVDDFLVKERKQKEQDYGHDEVQGTQAMQRQYENMTHTIEALLKQHFGESIEDSVAKNHIEFQPSLTPAHTYFQRILHQVQDATLNIQIPDFMHVDHSQRNLDPFVGETNELKQYFAQRGLKMHVLEVACQEDIEKVGIFQPLAALTPTTREFRANCDIKSEVWINELRRKEKRPDFQFRQPTATYGAAYLARLQQRQAMRERLEASNPFWEITATPSYLIKLNNDEEVLLDTLSSLQTFEEENMDPLEVPLDLPRRHLEKKLINSSESETESNGIFGEDSEQKPPVLEELVLQISNFDCWLLHGFTSKIREVDKRALRPYFPYSFRWLLETCAATIGVGWDVLYEQLMILEVMFHHGIKDWSNYKHLLRIESTSSEKDRQSLVRAYKDLW
ncbi:TATA box-binding protein-associated factor RNA polymerase I subunit B [Drosophila kikkawai]|uniref:TATA box-binding protein-associated factor RNA polymerase I subunit B n=1 Tax=Drosophila kikkawai TaxID=30033 RepID=A0A6P4ILN5_DROKI|nr:TATA box-binding protein-associated factor RNA polymerase I subunit B [Drosophila kikkawai]